MSTHANQAVKGGPSSGREEIRGSNATYKASMQKEARTTSSTKPAGDGKIEEHAEGVGSAPTEMSTTENAGGYGSGHYKPN